MAWHGIYGGFLGTEYSIFSRLVGIKWTNGQMDGGWREKEATRKRGRRKEGRVETVFSMEKNPPFVIRCDPMYLSNPTYLHAHGPYLTYTIL